MTEELKHKASETQAIVDLASKIQPVVVSEFAHTEQIAVPPGWTLQKIDKENLLLNPYRKKGQINLTDCASFIDYINRHKIADLTSIYCTADYAQSKIEFTAVINDHGGDLNDQQWRDYRAVYAPDFSEEWSRWSEKNGGHQTQVEFATFIEDNLNDIATAPGFPSGKDLYEMALCFEANQDKTLKSKIRLQSGAIEFALAEKDDVQTIEKMRMFERIAIGIPVFWGGTAYQIEARLKYRITQGALKFWYELIRADKVIEDATKTMIERIKTETAVPIYFGQP
ncbi:MAG: DUF2303 family protein [Desulfurellales bacterium]|nr:MAG: DUF2303 family protein [Desulfurellales bacterium]